MKHLMTDVVVAVYFIRLKSSNYQEFQAFLNEIGSEHEIMFCKLDG